MESKEEFEQKVDEKIIELKKKFDFKNNALGYYTMTDFQVKQCVKMHCEEILKHIPMYQGNINPTYLFYRRVIEKIV